MKSRLFLLCAAAVAMVAGCTKPANDGQTPDDTPGRTITMTTATQGEASISLLGTGEATIDWGDGSTAEKVALSETWKRCKHTYPSTTLREIVVAGMGVTWLDCRDNQLMTLNVSQNTALTLLYCYSNQLTTLDVSKNGALTTLSCGDNKLTTLDISKNTALRELRCENNKFKAPALNALFGTLHGNDIEGKEIEIASNPGTAKCDPSIATAKGWMVKVD